MADRLGDGQKPRDGQVWHRRPPQVGQDRIWVPLDQNDGMVGAARARKDRNLAREPACNSAPRNGVIGFPNCPLALMVMMPPRLSGDVVGDAGLAE